MIWPTRPVKCLKHLNHWITIVVEIEVLNKVEVLVVMVDLKVVVDWACEVIVVEEIKGLEWKIEEIVLVMVEM